MAFPLRRLPAPRRAALALLIVLGLLGASAPAFAAPVPLDLETLSGGQAEKLLQEGKVTSVQLVKAYEARIQALNKAGPGLNAVTQINPNALTEAKLMDKERAKHV